MRLTTGLFLGIGAGAVRGASAVVPKITPKTRAEYDAWDAEQSMIALEEAIVVSLGGLALQAGGLCKSLPSMCQFAWGYAGVSTLRWMGSFLI